MTAAIETARRGITTAAGHHITLTRARPMTDKPINLDEYLYNAAWSKRTPDRWEDLDEEEAEQDADDDADREP